MSFESVDWDGDETEDYPPEPRWLQAALATLGASIAIAVAIWGLMVSGPISVGGVVLGEAIGWSLCGLYIRELTKPR